MQTFPIEPVKERVCKICGEAHPLTPEFWYAQAGLRDGLKQPCKQCVARQQREYRKANAEAIRERKRKYYLAHREETLKRVSAYQAANMGKAVERVNKWREENREHFNARQRERKAKDPRFKMVCQVRTAIAESFNRTGYAKPTVASELTGLSSDELTDYLFETFRKNYGREWDGVEAVHIDHIIPLATAESIDDVKRLCHYTNLQLLTAEDNLRKHNRLDYELTTPQERM